MSKGKNTRKNYRPLSPRGTTTGPRECRECDAPAYSHHRKGCPKTD